MQIKKIRFFSGPLFYLFFGLILLQVSAQEVYDGYIFYSKENACFLVDNEGNEIHKWESEYRAAGAAHLLRDSSVLYIGEDFKEFPIVPALAGGRFQIIKWNGELAWDFKYATSEYVPHHNIEVMHNNNTPEEMPHILAICAEMATGSYEIMVDKITEIKPTGKTTGEVVWQWHSWDHRTSSPDNQPGLLDDTDTGWMSFDWTHMNSVSYNEELDQIVLGVKHFNEFMIIDHSTTTLEAAGSTGGKYGKGGNILYRWGCPTGYGCSGNDYIDAHHSAVWIPKFFPGSNEEIPGGGNVLFLHNSTGEAVEIKLPGNGDGFYPREDRKAFAPASPLSTLKANYEVSPNEGSVQRLPNGNILFADWMTGKIVEMSPDKKVLLELSTATGVIGGANQAHKYSIDYLGPATKTKEKTFFQKPVAVMKAYPNPVNDNIHISFNTVQNNVKIEVTTLNGKKVFSQTGSGKTFNWNAANRSAGTYLITAHIGDKRYTRYINVMR